MTTPSREEFRELCQHGNLVPVYREIIADTETPVSTLRRLGTTGYAFLLESVTGGENLARYSFLGVDPQAVVTIRGRQVVVNAGGLQQRHEVPVGQTPLDVLRGLLSHYRYVAVEGLPRFCGGLVGYLSYDMVRHFEDLRNAPEDDLELPDSTLMLAHSLVIFDHVSHTMKILVNAHVDGDPDTAYSLAEARIDDLARRLAQPPANLRPLSVLARDVAVPSTLPAGVTSSMTKERFEAAVTQCKEYIAAGDAIQVVLSQRLAVDDPGDPFDVYRCLRCVNPSPYMYYLSLGSVHIVGSSPEILVTCDQGRARVRPIAGTRPRGKTREDDLELERDLLADEKERAEHIMLVDLGRNDLGRVCEYGSVRVTEQMVVERYSHVMHIVSDVTGRLREGQDQFDVLAATFPAGTVSGAPKIRAMEIIDELEPVRRGPYAGAVGYFGVSGTMDTCITIRTLVFAGGRAYLQAGAGIVADSVPEREYQECLNKARALLRAIDMAKESAQ